MEYITEIKAFYSLVEDKDLSTGAIALWHALMFLNNKCYWKESFDVSNLTLQLYTGLSRQAILKNRNILKQIGLIDFRPNGTKSTTYKLNTMSNNCQVACQDSCQDSCQVSCQVGCQEVVKPVAQSNRHKDNRHKDNSKREIRKEKIAVTDVKTDKRFCPPTLSEVQSYCTERNNNVNAEQFVDYYTANGWQVGKNKMKDWKACVRNWEKNGYDGKTSPKTEKKSPLNNFSGDFDDDFSKKLLDMQSKSFETDPLYRLVED